jgi:hypothetical protein
MSEMGSHDPFGHFKHKLCPKEGLGVKLTIWLMTIKSQESPWFPCVQVACNIPFKICWQRIQLCFRPHFNWRFAHKIMGPQSCGSPQLWEFRDSHLGVLGQNDIWVLVLWPGTKYTIRGKVVVSPKFGPWWILWICVCRWFVRAPKCSNYVLTNLLFGLCRSMWVIEFLVNLPSPIPKLKHALLPLKCYKLESAPQLLLLPLFSPLDSQLSPSRSFGVRQLSWNQC